MLHHTGLFLHMVGILLAGAGSIGAILAEKQLWKNVSNQPAHARVFVPILQSAASFILAGITLFIISGLIMLYSANWIYMRNPWFDARLICFVLLPVRGALIGKPAVVRIHQELQSENINTASLMALRLKMKRFHMIQFTLVAVIIFLVIFKV